MILIRDNVIPKDQLEASRQSAIQAGFGNWIPPSHTFGSGIYKGMCWAGNHAVLHMAVSAAIGGKVIHPNKSFYRILTSDEEKRLIHSDRSEGDCTAIFYLSNHEIGESGTAFYRHKETGFMEMPTLEEMREQGSTEKWGEDFKDDSKWDRIDFVSGLLGRMLVFSAPRFHARVPNCGIGSTPEDARMIWVCHFKI